MKLLGENETEVVLQRLDRLTVEESRVSDYRVLHVIRGLFHNMQVVMDGAHCLII